MSELEPAKAADELIEKLADLEHERWSGWMRYLFTKGQHTASGGFLIDYLSVHHWVRQCNVPYAQLSEREKESDRKEVRKTLAALNYARTLFEFESNRKMLTVLGKNIQELLEQRDALQRELEEAKRLLDDVAEHLYANVPSDGWGIRDKRADSERGALLKRINAALSGPPKETEEKGGGAK